MGDAGCEGVLRTVEGREWLQPSDYAVKLTNRTRQEGFMFRSTPSPETSSPERIVRSGRSVYR